MKPSVIDCQYAIGSALCLGLIFTVIISAIHSKVTESKFITLCSLFVDKFGARPAEVLIYQNGGVFFSFMRDAFSLKLYISRLEHSTHEEWIMIKSAS